MFVCLRPAARRKEGNGRNGNTKKQQTQKNSTKLLRRPYDSFIVLGLDFGLQTHVVVLGIETSA